MLPGWCTQSLPISDSLCLRGRYIYCVDELMLAHHNQAESTVYTGNPSDVVHSVVWDKVMVMLYDMYIWDSIVPYIVLSAQSIYPSCLKN